MSANVTSQTKPHPSTTLWRAHLVCIGTALWLDRVGVLALTLAFALGLAPLLPLAASDLGLVGVLSTDEALAGRIVRHMVQARTASPDHFFAYGALTFDLAALLLAPAAALGHLSDLAVVVALRAVSLAGGAATVALSAALARRLAGPWAALAAAALAAVTPELVAWSVTAHPDTLQLALLTGTLLTTLALVEHSTRTRLLLGATLAGLAFGTKYLGVLLVPLLLVAAALGRRRVGRGRLRDLTRDTALLAVAFAAAFALTNPYALLEPARALAQVRAEIAHAQAGHVFALGGGPLAWPRVLISPGLGGPLMPALAVVGTVACLAARGPVRARAALLTGWAAAYLAYLMIRVGYEAPRYALPLVPEMAALAAAGLVRCARPAVARAGRIAWVGVVVLLLVAVLLPSSLETVRRVQGRLAQAAGLERDARVQAGRWLDAVAPAGTSILTDAYVYLPVRRVGVTVTFGLTRELVERVRPRYIVTNEDIRGRFRWAEGATRYVDGPAAYTARQEAYAALEEGRLGCYRLARDFGAVKVYHADCEAPEPR
jgi:4-amino-4-deoxy-L-arabinose transferase-like glycosyltransferase